MPGLFGGGSTTSTTQVNVPPPSAAELELQEVNLATARVLFDQLVTSTNLQNNVLLPLFAEQAGIILEFAPETGAAAAGAPAAAPVNQEALQAQLRDLNLNAQAQREHTSEEGGPGFVDTRTQRQIDAVTAQLETAQAGEVIPPTAAGPTPGAITGFSLTPEAQGRLDLSQQVQTAGLEAQLSAAEGVQALAQSLIEETPEFSLEEALAFIDAAQASAIASGSNEILRFQELALENLFTTQASARGLRPTDSPIGQFGASRVLEESTRQQGQLVRDVTTTSEQLKAQAQQFQAALEQQAFVNRSNLLGTLGNFGLGFPSAPSPGAQIAPAGTFGANLAQGGIPGAELQASLAQQRIATAPTTTTSSGGGGNIVGGLAGLAQGLGALGFNPFGATAAAGAAGAAPFGFAGIAGGSAAAIPTIPFIVSSRAFKTENEALDVDAILGGVAALDVERWRYRPEMNLGQARHIGPYAEDFHEAFAVGDGVTIGYMDAIGVLFASVQALAARLKELEN